MENGSQESIRARLSRFNLDKIDMGRTTLFYSSILMENRSFPLCFLSNDKPVALNQSWRSEKIMFVRLFRYPDIRNETDPTANFLSLAPTFTENEEPIDGKKGSLFFKTRKYPLAASSEEILRSYVLSMASFQNIRCITISKELGEESLLPKLYTISFIAV